jgi:hypothetical protein
MSEGSPSALDALRAVVAEGDGVVARFPGVLLVAAGPDTELRRLLELCRGAAGPSPGRGLARRLAAWLGGDDAPPDDLRFGTLSTTDRGLAVFLRGTVDLLVPDRGTAIAGADATTWTDRLIDVPDAPMALTLQGATAPADLLGGVLDLREGVVPGIAVVAATATVSPEQPVLPVEPNRAAGPARKDGSTTGEHEVVAPPAEAAAAPAPAPVDGVTEVLGRPSRHRKGTGAQPVPGSPAAARAALRAGVERAAEREKAEREKAGRAPAPTPARSPDPAPAPAAPVRAEEAPKAEGYLCARGHLNDPRSHFCVLCGIRMNESTGVLVVDERPPLGILVFDDGTTHTVDAGYLLGREPEGDARVRSGVLRPITLDDPSGAMSRVHAEIRLDNWDVLLSDSGSSNGTLIAEPGMQVWTMLAPSRPFRLVPGVRVRLGQRTFTFETPSGVR